MKFCVCNSSCTYVYPYMEYISYMLHRCAYITTYRAYLMIARWHMYSYTVVMCYSIPNFSFLIIKTYQLTNHTSQTVLFRPQHFFSTRRVVKVCTYMYIHTSTITITVPALLYCTEPEGGVLYFILDLFNYTVNYKSEL